MIQPGQQHLSLQLQQRRENPMDDRHKPPVGSSTDMRPPLASLGQSPVITPADNSSPIKVPYIHHVSRA
jgi:CCR4-NOT transcription complex subunit 1